MNQRIGEDIKRTHNRVADTYGLSQVDPGSVEFGYDDWNMRTNVMIPVGRIVNKFWVGSHILDAGCGNGQISEILIEKGIKRITGIDFSDKMLRNACRRFALRNMHRRFFPVRANLEELTMIRPESFDGAILFGVLEHLDSPEKVISEIWALIKPGGIFTLAVPRKYSLSHLTYLLLGESPRRWGTDAGWWNRFRFVEKSRYYRFFSSGQISRILSTHPNMDVLERVPFAFSHMDGLAGILLHRLGKNSRSDYRWLDRAEHFCQCCRLVPGGEFWIIRKTA